MRNLRAVVDVLPEATARLRNAGIDSPSLDAELLVGSVLGCTRLQVIAHPERVLTDGELLHLNQMVDKRAGRYPLAYILGEKEFYGLAFEVTSDVLIPRPETEVLVEQVLARLNAGAKIADVGVGSGAIAVTLAVNLPDAQVWATDTSEQALKVARANAEKHAVSGRVRTLLGDLLAPAVETQIRFDAVVSNPPYIPSAVIGTLEPEVRYEPLGALDGGPDGLDVYRKLFPQASQCTDLVAVEMGMGQGDSVADIARAAGFSEIEIVPDLAGIERVAIARR